MMDRDAALDRPEDRVISLRALEEEDPGLAGFWASVRSTYEEPISEEVAAAHLGSIMQAVRAEAAAPVSQGARRRVRVVAVLAAAFMTVGMIIASLSFAGVITWSPSAPRAPRVDHQAPALNSDGSSTGSAQVTPASSGAPGTGEPLSASNPNAPGAGHGKGRGDDSARQGQDAEEGYDGGDSADNPAPNDCEPLAGNLHSCLP